MDRRIIYCVLGAIVVVLIASAAFLMVSDDHKEGSSFIGDWEMVSGTDAGFDKDGKAYEKECEKDLIHVTKVQDGFADVSFEGNMCIGVCNGNTVTCYALGSGSMEGWLFYDVLTFYGDSMRLAFVGYSSITQEIMEYTSLYRKVGSDITTVPSVGVGECPVPIGVPVQAIEAYKVAGGVRSDILSNGYVLNVGEWKNGCQFFTVTFTEDGTDKTFEYVSCSIGDGIHLNACRNGDSILVDYMLIDGDVITTASTNWNGDDCTMYVVKYSITKEPSPGPDYSFLEGKVFGGKDRYVVDGSDKKSETDIVLTVVGVEGNTASIRTEFGGNTSEWGAIMYTSSGSSMVSLIADTHFVLGDKEYSGRYCGVYDKDSGKLTISGNAFSEGSNLGLLIDLQEKK